MHGKLTIALIAGVALAGCNNSQPQQAQTNEPAIKVRGSEQNRMHELNAFDLAIALKRAIYDAGFTCKRVTDGGYIGSWKNLDMWMAHCTDGTASRDWAVFTGPDGSAQVRDCKDIPGTGLPDCVIKKRPQGSFTDIPAAGTQDTKTVQGWAQEKRSP
jgi:hypothetical protein